MPVRQKDRMEVLGPWSIFSRRATCDTHQFIKTWVIALIMISHSSFALLTTPPNLYHQSRSLIAPFANETSLLECLQVTPPILSPAGGCQQTLMNYTFAYSYGQPFKGFYHPPNCDFNRVTFNFTVTSAGRQFDRLALMYLDDIEVFRTSTAEPTRSGIIWTYVKDMSSYLALFRKSQNITFDLGNLVDDTYTGVWNTTLTATFFSADDTFEPADLIIPMNAYKPSVPQNRRMTIPESNTIQASNFPQNAKKAVFSISACGQATEEFWWSNVLSSDSNAFGNETTLYGQSPFRELQLLIDGKLAGVAWPFPVIFTGGVVPGFWRPIVGIDAFDLKEDEIDISPFIPLLSDGGLHTFEIRVIGIDDDGKGNGKLGDATGSNWVVTGKIFTWLDENTNRTTGGNMIIQAPEPSIKVHSTSQRGTNGTVQSVDYSVQVSRQLSIAATVNTPRGVRVSTWTQELTFSSTGTIYNNGNNQMTRQSTHGSHRSSTGFFRIYEYPLQVNSTYNVFAGGNFSITGDMQRRKDYQQMGDLAFPNEWKVFDFTRAPWSHDNMSFQGTQISNRQNGTASYLSVPAQKKSYGSGSTEQFFLMAGLNEAPKVMVQDSTSPVASSEHVSKELYRRHIAAANDSIVYDDESFGGRTVGQSRFMVPTQWIPDDGTHDFAEQSVRSLLGRGPA